ncbi:hypothetical protein P167DRAFT_531447 [Morchella conica CCBAS932]|uniref:Uncharacterized protein n=1 Tax=Morchella conica CCBAS932 TaxID=1392247 RepID=A0A3N4L979_9PEZI|nr:hypothetical protein P167DRAFT_531447 [Morchella conica CCBAS932]
MARTTKDIHSFGESNERVYKKLFQGIKELPLSILRQGNQHVNPTVQKIDDNIDNAVSSLKNRDNTTSNITLSRTTIIGGHHAESHHAVCILEENFSRLIAPLGNQNISQIHARAACEQTTSKLTISVFSGRKYDSDHMSKGEDYGQLC